MVACSCTPKPAPETLPPSPGLHLVATFAPGERAAERLANRLPDCAANALAMRAELATADAAAYERARVDMSALVAGINESLPLDRPLSIFLLPAELRPTNLPELSNGGVVLLADEPEDMVVWRLLRGVALTHPRLPPPGTLLADVVRGGVASRFAISEVQPDALDGTSPFVPYPPEMVAQRLPHLLAMVIHHPEEPKASYRSGWLERADLELLGWLGTNELTDWRAWLGAGPADAYELTATVLAALAGRAGANDQPARPEGFFGSDFALQLTHGDRHRAERILITYKRGMALLRVHRTNIEGRAARVLGRVDPEPLARFLEELESLNLATLLNHQDLTLDNAVRYQLTAHSQAGTVAFGFDQPFPTDDERYSRVATAFAELVATAERGE